ncbi:DUF6283 family protein [Catenulispora rubra]|uniref:DUF6283 family protein n=1 Tax=Catenulispora rubra TaxID=280293 RepID=UPI0018925884|nr:DUF6283 family protein [Catenulispora rubra]
MDQSAGAELKGPAQKPCAFCPYRQDCPSGVWSAEDYAKLPEYDKPTLFQPQKLFQCHLREPGAPGRRACGGWAACHNKQSGEYALLALRIAPFLLPPETVTAIMEYESPIEVFSTGLEAALHGVRDIANPSEQARSAIDKVLRARSDVTAAYEPSAGRDGVNRAVDPDDGLAEVVLLAARHCPRPRAADGDCNERAPLVTQDLVAAGFDATTAVVWGWSDKTSQIIGFIHRVTAIESAAGIVIVDSTATQFAPDLPAPWASPIADYCARLAQATAVEAVTITINGVELA